MLESICVYIPNLTILNFCRSHPHAVVGSRGSNCNHGDDKPLGIDMLESLVII